MIVYKWIQQKENVKKYKETYVIGQSSREEGIRESRCRDLGSWLLFLWRPPFCHKVPRNMVEQAGIQGTELLKTMG